MTGFETTLLLAFLGVVAIAYWALRRSILVTAWLRIKWRHYLTALNAAQDLDLQVSVANTNWEILNDAWEAVHDKLTRNIGTLQDIIDDADADIAMLHTNITEMWLEYQAMQMERNGAYKDLARLDADYESLGDEFTAYRLAHPVTHRRDSLGRFAKVEFEETPEPDAEAKAEPAPNIEPAEVASEKPLLAEAKVDVDSEYIESLEAENAALTLLHTQATDEMLKMQNRLHKLEAEIAQLKKDKLEFKAQCYHKDETK